MKKIGYFILGIFDLITLCNYLVIQLIESRIPFYSDFIQMNQLASRFGEGIKESESYVYVMATPFLIVYLSLFLSIWLYFKQSYKVRWAVLFQTPFRVISLITTIPFLTNIFQWLFLGKDNFTVIAYIFYILVALIEIMKTIYIFRICKN